MATVPSGFGAEAKFRGGSLSRQDLVYPPKVQRRLSYPNIPANELLERAARHLPDHPGVHFLGHEWTFAQLNEAAGFFAVWLQQHSIHGGDRVGVLLPNCPEYLIALNGIWKAGAVAVAMSPLSTQEDVARQCELTNTRLLVSLDLFDSLVPSAIDRVHVTLHPYLSTFTKWGYSLKLWTQGKHSEATDFWSAVEGGKEADLIPVERLPAADPAYILSTGGTTGSPKAVTLSHRNLVANAWQQMHWLAQTYSAPSASAPECMGRESMLAVLPFFHSYGMSTMMTTGCALGAKLIVLPRFNVRKTLACIEEHQPTVFHTVPAMLSALNEELRSRPRDLESIKWVISGGAPLPLPVATEFGAHTGAQVVEGYGLSEASPVTHVGPLNGTNQLGTIGLPLPDTDCRIVGEDGKDVEDGDIGELLIRGPQVMLGYWRNPEATRAVIRDGWLHTGDLARCVGGGFYQIVDRKKDLIITSGFNVYPADVEDVLRECEDIEDVAVVGVPDERAGEVVKAFVVLRKGVSWSLAQLEKFSRARLAKHRQPKLWEHVQGDLPRNFLGKVIRRELRESVPDFAVDSCDNEGDV